VTSSPVQQSARSSIGSSTLGAVIGAALIFYAQSFDPTSSISKWLLFIAPAIAVGSDKISAFVVFKIKIYARRQTSKEVRTTIREYLQNPDTSDRHKENLRRKLEEIEIDSIETIQGGLLNPKKSGRSKSNNSIQRRSATPAGPGEGTAFTGS